MNPLKSPSIRIIEITLPSPDGWPEWDFTLQGRANQWTWIFIQPLVIIRCKSSLSCFHNSIIPQQTQHHLDQIKASVCPESFHLQNALCKEMFTGNVPKMYESSRSLLVKSLSNHVCSNEHRLMFLSEPGPMPSPHHVSHVLKVLAQFKVRKKNFA